MDKPGGEQHPREATRLGEAHGTRPSPEELRTDLDKDLDDLPDEGLAAEDAEEEGESSRQAEEAATDEKSV